MTGPAPGGDTVLRLPAGWAPGEVVDGYAVAAAEARRPGDPIVFHRAVPSTGDPVGTVVPALVAELEATYDDLLLIDLEPIRARRGAAAVRLLTCWRQGDTSRTAEHRIVDGGDVVHVLAAVTATQQYAGAAAGLRSVLDRFRPGAETVPERVFVGPGSGAAAVMADVEIPDIQMFDIETLDIEIFLGRRVGSGAAQHDGRTASVLLPGLDHVSRVAAPLLPGWLAALVQLGPRPRASVTGHLVTERPCLDRLLTTSRAPDDVRDVLGTPLLPQDWCDALATFADADVRHWRVGPLEVVDAGDGGLWQVVEVDDAWLEDELDGDPLPELPVAVRPTDPTQVWEALAGLIGCPARSSAR